MVMVGPKWFAIPSYNILMNLFFMQMNNIDVYACVLDCETTLYCSIAIDAGDLDKDYFHHSSYAKDEEVFPS